MDRTDFYLERKLRKEDERLHQNVRSGVVVLQGMLQSFLSWFPDFTDHSVLHSMDVLEFCNQLIGQKTIEKLSVEECYILIMACYLHDAGMGISRKDYDEFTKKIDFGEYFLTHDREDKTAIIRDFHQEYSGQFIRKYAGFFEIPSDELLFSIVQVSRGHRKTDLLDEKEYPNLQTEHGVIRTPYLASLIRLADEIDVASDRNPELLYDTSKLTRQRDIDAFGTHESIRRVEVTEDSIILHTKPKSPEFVPLIESLADKIRETLDTCRDAAAKRTDLRITQEKVVILSM